MTYPQQQQPFPYGGYGPPPPPPPKKNTAAIVSVVAAVVLLLAGLGITGFVAPGFFLADDETPTGGGGTPSSTTSSQAPDTSGGEDVLEAVADGLDGQDKSALRDLACADAESIVDEAIDDADAVTKASLTDTEEVSDDEVTGTVEVFVDDESAEFEVTAVTVDDDWCWQDIRQVGGDSPTASSEPAEPTSAPSGEPTAGGKPVPAGALTAMQAFLDAINAGDAAAAKATLCKDAINTPADVDELVGYDPDLQIDPTMDGISSSAQSVQLYLRGTAKGQELEGYSTNLWVTSYDGAWCVHAFRAVVI
ncbi:hypothetical protein [Actinophytocola sp. KF-1]